MALIAITGTPGVGKSHLTEFLIKHLGADHIDLHRQYKNLKTVYNYKKQCYDLDYTKVMLFVKKKKAGSKVTHQILDSHISHCLPSDLVDIVIVLTTNDLNELTTRLRNRKYSEKKIRENLECEMFQVCFEQAQQNHRVVFRYDTSKKNFEKDVLKDLQKTLSVK